VNHFCAACRVSFPGLTLRIDFQEAKKMFLLDDADIDHLRAIIEPTSSRSVRSRGSFRFPEFIFEFHVRRYAILKYGSMEELPRRSVAILESSDRATLRSSNGKRKRSNDESDEYEIASLRKSRGDVRDSNLDSNDAEWPLWIPGSNFQL
jgi:hypothetical protein